MGVAKSDFSQTRQIRPHLIKNVERFVRIDLDYEKERGHYVAYQLLV